MSTPNSAPSIPSTAQSALTEALAAHPEVEPSMLEALAESEPGEVELEISEGETKRQRNLSWNDALKQVPPDIRNLMKNMQRDYTKKTQELAEQRKDFLREREALMKGSESLRADSPLPDFDPFNESSIAARIEAEVNKRLAAVLEPMKREYQTIAAEDAYQSFLGDHPEFKTDMKLRAQVQELLEANASLDLETAYYAVRGKNQKAESAREAEMERARKAANREAAAKTALPHKGAATAPATKSVKAMSNADIFALAQAMNRR